MSSTFTEFLREQAAKRKVETVRRTEVIGEWTDSINRLLATIRGWLQVSDPDGILRIKEEVEELHEEGLGRYTVPRLDIHGLGRWVGIIPKARFTVGTAHPPQKTSPERATGRVDITDEVRRHILYRFPGESGDVWLISSDPMGLRRPKVLDQAAFEAALMSYLQ
jgi:hypothetical protein